MNRENIIRMAREAKATEIGHEPPAFHFYLENLEAFAELVASAAQAKEREACIEDIQWHIPRAGRHTPEYQNAMRMLERIKARGQA